MIFMLTGAFAKDDHGLKNLWYCILHGCFVFSSWSFGCSLVFTSCESLLEVILAVVIVVVVES